MKTLLALLGSLTITSSSTVVVMDNLNVFKNNKEMEHEVLEHYAKIERQLNDNADFETLLETYSEVPDMIYKIMSEESLNQYMAMVYQLKNRLDSLAKTEQDKMRVEEQRTLIERALNDWNNDLSIKELILNYSRQITEEKYALSKLYYAYNQTSSHLILEDLTKFQDIRIENIKASASITTLENQKELLNKHLEEWESTLEWQKILENIYDNWIDEAESLNNEFQAQYNRVLGSPENFFKNMIEKSDLIVDYFVDKYYPEEEYQSNEDIKEYLKGKIEDRDQNPDEKVAKWVLIGQDNPSNGDPEENPVEITNEQLQEVTAKELEERFEEAGVSQKRGTKDEETTKLDIMENVFLDIYKIDDIMFGSMHKSADAFFEFVNNQIPRLSDDVKKQFEAKGVKVETAFDEKINDALKISKEISMQVLKILNPKGSEAFEQIAGLAFASYNEIQKWFETFEVMSRSNESIEIIKETKEMATKIPDELLVDVDKTIEELKVIDKDLAINKEIFDRTNEELKHSQFDKLDSNLKDWNNFFSDYADYLSIEDLSMQRFKNPEIELNPKEYFTKQLEMYERIVIQREYTYNQIIRIANIEEILGEKYDEIIYENNNLSELNSFIVKHKGDF